MTVVNNNEIDASVPASFLTVPRRYALDVIVGGVGSNPTDFSVVQSVNLRPSCTGSTAPSPASVVIDSTRNIAVVSNSGCGSISIVDLTPGAATPLKKTIAVGTSPAGIDVIPRLGYAVVANNGDGTASIVNLNTGTVVSSPSTGTNPTGVAINQFSGVAIVANTGSNSISAIDLTSITSSTTTPTVNTLGIDQQPIAVAIDPNRAACGTTSQYRRHWRRRCDRASIGHFLGCRRRRTRHRGRQQQRSGAMHHDHGSAGFGNAYWRRLRSCRRRRHHQFERHHQPASRPFLRDRKPRQCHLRLQSNHGVAIPAAVGINPTSLAVNPNTGTLLTVNTLSNTISVLDTQTLQTRATMGVTGSTQFAAAIDPLTNMAVIADATNNRLLILPLPN